MNNVQLPLPFRIIGLWGVAIRNRICIEHTSVVIQQYDELDSNIKKQISEDGLLSSLTPVDKDRL